jgi:EAL domain-containing protein (putative c-di-GMP-specific phosphodiesterase class I)
VQRPVDSTWLFLNVDPSTVVRSPHFGRFFGQLLAESGLGPHRVVVEVLETASHDEQIVADGVQLFRDLGCLVAIDDVGAGHSNFERVWRASPDIVKLDRVIATASSEARVRRILPGFVAVFHEAGYLVVMEGIETEAQALAALDADVDFLQGYFFARPAAECDTASSGIDRLERLNDRFHARAVERARREKGLVSAYKAVLSRTADMLAVGRDPTSAFAPLLELPAVDRCFVLDARGVQIGPNLEARSSSSLDPRYDPVADASGANWCRRAYFRRATSDVGTVQATRPYLSIRDRRPCVTLSVAFHRRDALLVACVDLAWDRVFREGSSVELDSERPLP